LIGVDGCKHVFEDGRAVALQLDCNIRCGIGIVDYLLEGFKIAENSYSNRYWLMSSWESGIL
jgi:hypothetical protein